MYGVSGRTPWNGNEKRWKPDKLAVENKVEARAIKWVRKDNVQTSFANGMRVASRADYGGLAETYGLGGEGEGTGVIQRGNLILMETSQANAEARRKWARMKPEQYISNPPCRHTQLDPTHFFRHTPVHSQD